MAEVDRNLNGGVPGNGTSSGNPIVVRAEEAVIVVLVLALWVAAIALFFNRWGKIRMLEPYQPKFTQQHRTSSSLVDPTLIQPRSLSKFNLNGETFFNQQNLLRPRQNSVFVGSSMTYLPVNAPRKVKSAFDLQNLLLSDPALNNGCAAGTTAAVAAAAAAAAKINFDEDRFRRQSLLAPCSKKSSFEHWQIESIQKAKERRLSFKDLVDMERSQKCERVLCYLEREPADFEFSRKNKRMPRRMISNQGSQADSRHNSIANPDPKSIPGKFPSFERKNSSLPVDKDGSANLPEPEGSESRSDFRRNSSLLFESDRNFLNPRESIKSGVIDFRRNSLLIINSLTEDVGYRSFKRDFPLGGSNVALGSDFSDSSARRNSAMNLPFGCCEVKVQKVKGKPGLGSRVDALHRPAGGKKRLSRKPSKSLDCGESGKASGWQGRKEPSRSSLAGEIKPRFLAPATPRTFAGSSASLNASYARPEVRPIEESRSAGAIHSGLISPEAPAEVERGESDRKSDPEIGPPRSPKSANEFRPRTPAALARETFFREKEQEPESVPTVNVTMFGPTNSDGTPSKGDLPVSGDRERV